jgi:hypothetical protein
MRLTKLTGEEGAATNELLNKVNAVFHDEDALTSDVLNVCVFLATIAAVDLMTKEKFLAALSDSWDVLSTDNMEVH